MATWTGEFGSNPTWSYSLTATCTSRTSTQATIKIDLSLGLKILSSSTRFGYNYYWEPIVTVGSTNTSGGWQWVKDSSPNWSDGAKRNFSRTITVNAAANITSVTVKFNTKSTNGGGSAYTPATSRALTIAAGNTAPIWNTDDMHIYAYSQALKANNIIPENAGAVLIKIPSAKDAEGNQLKYTVSRYSNNIDQGMVGQVTANQNTAVELNDNISKYVSGDVIKYNASVSDGTLEASGSRWSWLYTKNIFQKATVSGVGSVQYKTGFNFTVTNGKNQGGICNNTCDYTLSSQTSGVKLYGTLNKQTTASGTYSWPISIDSGTTYLKYEELKSLLSGSKYKGTIKLRLESRNSYGSSGYYDFNVSVDLTTSVPKVTGITYSGGTVTIGSNKYYCPEKANTMSVAFDTITDPLGGTVNYKVHLEDGHNSIYLGTASVSSGKGSYTVNLKSSIGNIDRNSNSIVVEAYTSYGNSSYASGETFNTYSYTEPTISITELKRVGTTATINGRYTLGTDLPVVISGLTYQLDNGTGVAYTLTGSGRNRSFSISAKSLADKTYAIKVNASDSYITKSTTGTIPIGDPMFSLRKNGVGVNCIPSGKYNFEVNGSANIKSLLINGSQFNPDDIKTTFKMKSPNAAYSRDVLKTYDGDTFGMGLILEGGGNTIIGSGESATTYMNLLTDSSSEILYCTSDTNIGFVSGCQTIENRKEMTWDTNGLLSINTGSVQSHTGFKVTGSSGSVCGIWSGTDGVVLQSHGNYNLHLGRDNINDMTFYSDRIELRKELKITDSGGVYGIRLKGNDILINNRRALVNYTSDGVLRINFNNDFSETKIYGNVLAGTMSLVEPPTAANGRLFTVTTQGDGNGSGDGSTHLGYKGSDGFYYHYFRGKGRMAIDMLAGTSIAKELKVPKVITDKGTYSLLNRSNDDATVLLKTAIKKPNYIEMIDFVKENPTILLSKSRNINSVYNYLTEVVDENIYLSESNRVEVLWETVSYLLKIIESIGGTNV